MTPKRPVPPGSSLYKYVRMGALKRVLEGTIRFTQPSAFNDPFELLPEIVIPNGEPERPVNFSFDLLAKRRQPPPGEVDVVPEGYGASDATSRDIVHQLNGLIGILCLSRTKDSLLMWSHYADQYAGAVIEFDGSHEFFAGKVDVDYRPSRPKRHLSAYLNNGQPIPFAELCIKSDQWEYEQEVRIIRSLSDCTEVGEDQRGFPVYTSGIPLSTIKSIILGERAKIADQREVYECIKETSIALLLAAVDHWGYSFRFEQIKFGVPASKLGPMMSPRTAHIFRDGTSQRSEFARWMVENHPMSKLVNKPV